MHTYDDAAGLPPDQRRREIASILARGILRLHGAATSQVSAPSDTVGSAENDLEASVPSRPHVTGG